MSASLRNNTKPEKVLFFTQSPLFGGDDGVLIELMRAWTGPETLILAINRSHPGRPIYQERLSGRAEIRIVDEPLDEPQLGESWRGPAQIYRPFQFLACTWRLICFLRDEQPDTILISSGGFPLAPLTFRMLLASFLRRTPRIILAVHSYPSIKGSLFRRLYLRLMAPLTLILCDHVVAVSHDCAAAIESFNPRACRPVRTIHNGLAPRAEASNLEQKRRKIGAPASPLIGTIGVLREDKGFDYLIRAMKKIVSEFPEAHLIIIGGPSPREPQTASFLRELVNSLGISNHVVFTGFIPNAGEYAQCFDICAIPSTIDENFVLLALDAMSYRKPMVASRLGALPEAIGDAGVYAAPCNENELAEAILSLLRDPARARQLGDIGYRRWMERFTAKKMADQYRELTYGRTAAYAKDLKN